MTVLRPMPFCESWWSDDREFLVTIWKTSRFGVFYTEVHQPARNRTIELSDGHVFLASARRNARNYIVGARMAEAIFRLKQAHRELGDAS